MKDETYAISKQIDIPEDCKKIESLPKSEGVENFITARHHYEKEIINSIALSALSSCFFGRVHSEKERKEEYIHTFIFNLSDYEVFDDNLIEE